jgi:hypothetical protein
MQIGAVFHVEHFRFSVYSEVSYKLRVVGYINEGQIVRDEE